MTKSLQRLLAGCFLSVIAVALPLPGAASAAPRDELLRLVPDDIALCLIVDNLREQASRFWKSATVSRFRQSALGRNLFDGGEMRDLAKLNDELKLHFKIDWHRLQNDVLGDCVVFAFHPGTPGAKDERGMLLVWAKDDKLLARLIRTINRAQRQSGELQELQGKKYKEFTYHRRVETKGDVQFYFQKAHLFAFSNREALLKKIIDRLFSSKSPSQSSALQRSLRRLPERNALLTFWVNPRAFDGEFQKKSETSKGQEKQVLKAFTRYWQALDAAAVTLTVQPNPSLTVTLQGRPDELPAPARKLFAQSSPSADLWGRFPADAAFAAAGRVDFSALHETLEQFAAPPKRRELRSALQNRLGALMGRDFIKDILPQLGPDVGMFVASAGKEDEAPHALFAMRVKARPDDAPADRALWNTINGLLIGAVAAHNATNKDPIVLKTLRPRGAKIRCLQHRRFPKGFAPAVALKSGYLLLASSPSAVARFQSKPRAVANPPLLRVSFRETSEMVKKYRRWLQQAWQRKNNLSPQASEELLTNLTAALGFFDRLEIDQLSAAGQVTWRVRLSLPK